MHVRFSTSRATPFVDQHTEEVVGWLSGILLNPDTGTVEGFYALVSQGIGVQELYCSSMDIIRWGTSIVLRDAEVFAPDTERIRLHDLLRDPRKVLGQKIYTETGKYLGVCKDVQFNTKSMKIEWLFPRRFLSWRLAVPIAEVLEVTPEKIIIRDQRPGIKESIQKTEETSTLETLHDITENPIPQPSRVRTK